MSLSQQFVTLKFSDKIGWAWEGDREKSEWSLLHWETPSLVSFDVVGPNPWSPAMGESVELKYAIHNPNPSQLPLRIALGYGLEKSNRHNINVQNILVPPNSTKEFFYQMAIDEDILNPRPNKLDFVWHVDKRQSIGFEGKEGTKFRELEIIPHDYDYSIELVGGKGGGEILVGDELGLQIGISNCVVQPKADFFHLIVNGNRTDVDWNEIKREEDCVYYECNITVPIEEGRRNVAFEVGSSTLKKKPRLRSSAFKVSERVVFNIQQESTERIHPLEGQNISLEIKNLADTPETRFVEIPGSTHRFDLKPQEVRMEDFKFPIQRGLEFNIAHITMMMEEEGDPISKIHIVPEFEEFEAELECMDCPTKINRLDDNNISIGEFRFKLETHCEEVPKPEDLECKLIGLNSAIGQFEVKSDSIFPDDDGTLTIVFDESNVEYVSLDSLKQKLEEMSGDLELTARYFALRKSMMEQAATSKRVSGGSGHYYAGYYPELHDKMRRMEKSHPLLERFRREHETIHVRPHVKHRLGDGWFAIEQDLEFDLKME